MAELLSIPGIGKASLELLEAAGFHDVESLSKVGADDLARELERANSILKISKRAPAKAAVEKWIAAARELAGIANEPEGPSLTPVDYEQTPQVVSMLAAAPFAIPLPSRLLVENQLGVADIPAGILLNRYSGDLDVRVDERLPKSRQPKPAVASSYVQIADNTSQKLEIDTSRIKSINDMDGALPKTAAVKTSPGNDRVALIRAPRSETNRGKDPNSRWYIRGVLHSHPVSIYFGALVTLLLTVMVPASVVSALLLLGSAEMPDRFPWVPGWLLWFPVTLPLFGIAWVIWGMNGSCRICGQKLFMHRSHRKNAKAHHIRGIGYVIPLCFQILIFRWFRCTHCGTPVRLKE
jgi:hypothetical protein